MHSILNFTLSVLFYLEITMSNFRLLVSSVNFVLIWHSYLLPFKRATIKLTNEGGELSA